MLYGECVDLYGMTVLILRCKYKYIRLLKRQSNHIDSCRSWLNKSKIIQCGYFVRNFIIAIPYDVVTGKRQIRFDAEAAWSSQCRDFFMFHSNHTQPSLICEA